MFKIKDQKDPEANLVVKITMDHKSFSEEIKHMNKVGKSVVCYGLANKNNTLLAWAIMPRLGKNLQTHFE